MRILHTALQLNAKDRKTTAPSFFGKTPKREPMPVDSEVANCFQIQVALPFKDDNMVGFGPSFGAFEL